MKKKKHPLLDNSLEQVIHIYYDFLQLYLKYWL